MAPILFKPIQQHVVALLKCRLPQQLTYHCLSHTLDVLAQAQTIARQEGITDEDEVLLLKIAALYHDSGFITDYQNHEAQSCEIARKDLPGYGFSEAQIDKVCGLIMATKIPQSPQNHLEQILCDADLDYLGRSDFSEVAKTLYQELKHHNRIAGEDEWNALQIKFLENHKYFTAYSQHHREHVKQSHLQSLKSIFQPG